MLTQKQLLTKRVFDIIISLLAIPVVLLPLLVLLIIASLDLGRGGLFVQSRIGRNGRPFGLLKIRTLKGDSHHTIFDIKRGETNFGRWLRESKLDEIPQIFNVLNGTMSMVGPRPDVKGYADILEGEDRVILLVRPGITGPATLKYRNEDALLLKQEDPKKYNDDVIWTDKIAINKTYIENWSLRKDVKYLLDSLFERGSLM